MDTNSDARIRQLEASCGRWRVVSLFALVIALLALIVPGFRGPFTSAVALPSSQPAPPTPSFEQLTVGTLKVKWLHVLDENGNTVVSLNEGAGGGILSVNSATPNDHNVMISATPYGATVQVSSQQKPRQFGFLKIMDRKPYLQMYEEGEAGSTRNFYQVPLYSADGNMSGPAGR